MPTQTTLRAKLDDPKTQLKQKIRLSPSIPTIDFSETNFQGHGTTKEKLVQEMKRLEEAYIQRGWNSTFNERDCEVLELDDTQQVCVRLLWCNTIYAKLMRTGLTDDNKKELFDIVSKAIDSANIYPKVGEHMEYIEDSLPSLNVPRNVLMSVGDVKKIINIYGTTYFSCYLPDYKALDIEVISSKQGEHKLVRKSVKPNAVK